MIRIAFSLFLLLFFRFTVDDVLSFQISSLFGHVVEPFPWITAFLLSILCGIINNAIAWTLRKLKLPAFISAFIIGWAVAALTSVGFVSWQYQLTLFITWIAVVAFALLWKRQFRRSEGNAVSFTNNYLQSVVPLLFLILFIAMGNGVTDVQHYELRTAQALSSNHPEKAYKVGEKAYETSPRLFAMRCYLLAKTQEHGLGQKMFEQVVPSGGARNLLLPYDERQKLLFPADSLYSLLGTTPHTGETALHYLQRCAWLSAFRKGNQRTAAIDYYLCALLLERKVADFAMEVNRYYPTDVARNQLPAYFAQALIMYQRTQPRTSVHYVDNNIEANHRDYVEMGDTIRHPVKRSNLLRRSYGETYWWWYAYGAH